LKSISYGYSRIFPSEVLFFLLSEIYIIKAYYVLKAWGDSEMGNDVPQGEQAEQVRKNMAYYTVGLGIPVIVITYWFFESTIAPQLVPVIAGMIGVIFGYYYGTKGVGAFEETADLATEKAKKAESEAIEVYKANLGMEMLEQQIRDYKLKLEKRKA
jgi:hypothetical protein